jgi:hypothetical protein
MRRFCESKALAVEVVMNEAEGTIREQVRRCIDIAGVFGAEGERCVCEPIEGNVWEGCGENGCFGRAEGTRWGWIVVGMVGAGERKGNGFRERPESGEKGFGYHCDAVGDEVEVKLRFCPDEAREADKVDSNKNLKEKNTH